MTLTMQDEMTPSQIADLKISQNIMAFFNPLGSTAAMAIGYSVLPAIGLSSLSAGSGSLHLAATSFLASGAILMLPSFALHILIDHYIENLNTARLLKTMLIVGNIVGACFLAPLLFEGTNGLPLLFDSLAGYITGIVFGLGLAISLLLIILLCSACCLKNDAKSLNNNDKENNKKSDNIHSEENSSGISFSNRY